MSLLHMKIVQKKENKRKTRLMLNIEKYKNIVLENLDACSIDERLNRMNVREYCNGYSCEGCGERVLKWLLEEAKEPILDEVEREYLSAVIRPFRNRVKYIVKTFGVSEARQFIRIIMHDGEYSNLPFFKGGTMYKGMKVDKQYTLQELGL